MKADEIDLLVDLIHLFKKYGPETFKALSTSLSSKEIIQYFPPILAQMAINLPYRQKRKKRKGHTLIKQSSLYLPVMLNNVDSNIRGILSELFQDLIERRVLPTLGDIREFAVEHNLSKINTSSRQKAIYSLIASFSKLPREQLVDMINAVKVYNKGSRGLEDWSTIILGKNLKKDHGSDEK
ncbi:MAG TPA: hypothetical protein VF399_06010 [bacterium]